MARCPPAPREFDDPAEAAFTDARRTPHPRGCFTEPVRLAQPLEAFPFERTYIRATADAPDAPGRRRVRRRRGPGPRRRRPGTTGRSPPTTWWPATAPPNWRPSSSSSADGSRPVSGRPATTIRTKKRGPCQTRPMPSLDTDPNRIQFVPGIRGPNIVGGEGCWLIADDGRRILDAAGGAIVANIGHGRDRRRRRRARRPRRRRLRHPAVADPAPRRAVRRARRALAARRDGPRVLHQRRQRVGRVGAAPGPRLPRGLRAARSAGRSSAATPATTASRSAPWPSAATAAAGPGTSRCSSTSPRCRGTTPPPWPR